MNGAEAPAVSLPEPPAEVPAWKLVGTLGGGGALAGLLLMFVFHATQPMILEHKAKVLAEAVTEVLGGPQRYETLFLVNGSLVAEEPVGPGAATVQRVYLGFDADDRPVGYAIPASQPGFQDQVRLIFGYDPRERRLLGMKVLENKETPGLGDKIEKDESFTGQFPGRLLPLQGVKGGGSGGEHEVDMITGATISSRAVVRIINDAVEQLEPALLAHDSQGVER
ncbi:MAG: RnfABCDGE type electron transport complex subunit G [Planctomycetota bacterium]